MWPHAWATVNIGHGMVLGVMRVRWGGAVVKMRAIGVDLVEDINASIL